MDDKKILVGVRGDNKTNSKINCKFQFQNAGSRAMYKNFEVLNDHVIFLRLKRQQAYGYLIKLNTNEGAFIIVLKSTPNYKMYY